jgi:hypothetical protein
MPPSSPVVTPWEKIYWLARMLINSDKYGGIGSEARLMALLGDGIRSMLSNCSRVDETAAVEHLKRGVRDLIMSRYAKATSKQMRVSLLCDDLETYLQSRKDYEALLITCECVMLPIHSGISQVPNDDRRFTLEIAKSYLDNLGEAGLSTVFSRWDDFGVKGSLEIERLQVVAGFQKLRAHLTRDLQLPESDQNAVLTAFVQEFERRLGQKRKGRAGGSVEDVTSFVLNYFNIPAANAPEHFQSDIEVDNWVKCKDGWLIGISCKRTLRERWKQVSSGDANLLSRFRIKNIWHITTFDEDLFDDKITLLGGQRHVFYLRDTSRRYQQVKDHRGMKDYVRPLSGLIKELRREQGSK